MGTGGPELASAAPTSAASIPSADLSGSLVKTIPAVSATAATTSASGTDPSASKPRASLAADNAAVDPATAASAACKPRPQSKNLAVNGRRDGMQGGAAVHREAASSSPAGVLTDVLLTNKRTYLFHISKYL